MVKASANMRILINVDYCNGSANSAYRLPLPRPISLPTSCSGDKDDDAIKGRRSQFRTGCCVPVPISLPASLKFALQEP